MPAGAVLHVSDLRFRYARGLADVLTGVSHEFTPGAITAMTGPSGCGKSTLLYLLGLLLRPTGGQVVVDGQVASTLSDQARSQLRAQHIGFVFQDAALDPTRTILDAVVEPALYGGKRRREMVGKATDLLTRMGVRERITHRPGQISGGQAQRVALCRCLINDPAIILADEPTGNLDQANAATVLGILRDAATHGRTIVIATHDPSVVEAADEVVDLSGAPDHGVFGIRATAAP